MPFLKQNFCCFGAELSKRIRRIQVVRHSWITYSLKARENCISNRVVTAWNSLPAAIIKDLGNIYKSRVFFNWNVLTRGNLFLILLAGNKRICCRLYRKNFNTSCVLYRFSIGLIIVLVWKWLINKWRYLHRCRYRIRRLLELSCTHHALPSLCSAVPEAVVVVVVVVGLFNASDAVVSQPPTVCYQPVLLSAFDTDRRTKRSFIAACDCQATVVVYDACSLQTRKRKSENLMCSWMALMQQ